MTDWRLKAAIQGVLSHVPGGAAANYRLQTLTGGLPIPDAKLATAVATARRHLDAAGEHLGTDLEDASFFEFGAGWDLHVPVAMHALGAGRQTVIDLNPLAREELVRDVCDRLRPHLPEGAREPVADHGRTFAELLGAMRITYQAPADARQTDLSDASVDVVTSTNTLEHIPAPDIARILREMRRILRPGGVLSAFIDYQDHYSYFDGNITVYNYLRYTDRQWRWFNNDLHHQNRLRHDDHLRLITDAGFQVIAVEPHRPDSADLEALERLVLAEPFASPPRENVGIRSALITAVAPDRQRP